MDDWTGTFEETGKTLLVPQTITINPIRFFHEVGKEARDRLPQVREVREVSRRQLKKLRKAYHREMTVLNCITAFLLGIALTCLAFALGPRLIQGAEVQINRAPAVMGGARHVTIQPLRDKKPSL